MHVTIRTRHPLLLVYTSLLSLAAACGAAAEPSPAGPGGTSGAGASTSAAGGDAAVWFLAPDQDLQESSTTFTALVSRLGCNNGVTGQVLEPEIHMSESEVVVTFSVAGQHGPADCQGNDQVPYEVDLGEPLQARTLVDGQCRPSGAAASTSFCVPDATRFRP
jgi:hypothetical protein